MRDLDLTTLRQANIVGSAISKRLAQLEDTVGTPLLQRRRHGVEPTPAGESLLEHARAMLASADQIERDMGAYALGIRGQVRILATASVMAESLADDVAAFLQIEAHHDIRVTMEERVSPDVIRGIKEGVASVGICWDAADLTGLQSCSYRNDHLAIVLHPSHPLAGQETLTFEQTLAHEHVSLPAHSAVQVLLQRAAALKGRVVVHRVIVSNFEAALRVVRANLAISVVPREVAEPYARTYGLRVLPLTDDWAQRRFAICFRDEASLSAAARLLVAHLVGTSAI
jgi:DNA-binding transcriptional LysR family regulator